MKDTKLLRALSTLKKEEWMSFRKYVLMNTGTDSEIYSLFAIFQSRKLNYAVLKSPDKFRIKYFPSVSQTAFFGMLSKLYKWLEEWFGIYEMQQTEYDKELYLIKALSRKGLTKEAKSHSVKLESKIKKQTSLNFRSNKVLAELKHFQYFNLNIGTIEERHEILLSACQKLSAHYKERSIFYIIELINRGKIYKKEFKEVKDMLNSSSAKIVDTEISKYGLTLIELLQNESFEALDLMKNKLLENTFKEGSEIEDLVHDYVRIYSNKLFTKNMIKDVDSYYELFNRQIEREFEIKEGKIDSIKFHNTVDQIANFISFERAEQFINKWIDYVETSKPKETKDLAYSQIYFIKRDFTKMFEYSQNISFVHHGNRTRAWMHNVICHFKFRHDNYDLAIQSLSSFKNYLKRNKKKFSKNFFNAAFNFASILDKLIKNDFKPVDIDLENYKVIFYRTWITEEVKKMKRK